MKKKILLAVALLIAVLLVGGAISLRLMTHGFSKPEEVPAAPGVFAVKNAFVYEYGAKTEGGTVVLFDAGIDREGRGIDALLEVLQAKRSDVKDVFLTHGHFDHVAGAPLLKDATVHAGIADRGFADGTLLPRGGGPMFSITTWLMPPARVAIGHGLSGRGEVRLGSESVLAIPCPGHTPGSMLYLYRGALFAGDSIQFIEGKLAPAPKGVTEDMAGNQRCLAELSKTLAGLDVKTICTGHTGCTPPDQTGALIAAASKD